jgi:PTH1 family peptidyl-tRNA hydrolase
VPVESSSQERQLLIVGLGNPGEPYRKTRHNLGFMVVEEVAKSIGLRQRDLECNALVAESPGVVLVWPQTYMNRSGYAVRCIVERHRISTDDALIVYDDVVLPLGVLRMRARGGPGGHRGMESVIHNVRTDGIARLRVGVGPVEGTDPGMELSDYVLEEFPETDTEIVERMIERAAAACLSWMREGAEATMTRFNG